MSSATTPSLLPLSQPSPHFPVPLQTADRLLSLAWKSSPQLWGPSIDAASFGERLLAPPPSSI